MDSAEKQSFIQTLARQQKIKWTRHARAEITPDHLSVDDVERALGNAVVIEDYPHAHRYLPDCLILAFVSAKEPIHVVVALNESPAYILIVTVYRPTSE